MNWFRRLDWRKSLKQAGFPVAEAESLLFGNLDVVNNEDAPWMLSKLANIYGHTYAIMLGAIPAVVTSDPDDDPTGPEVDVDRAVNIFGARGERWKRIRTLSSPALSTQNLKRLYPTAYDSIIKFMEGLRKDAVSQTPVDLHSTINTQCPISFCFSRFQRLAYDVISRCCLGRKESIQENDPNLALILKKFSANLSFHKYTNETFSWCIPELKGVFATYRNIMNRIYSAFGKPMDPFAQYAQNLKNLVESKTKSQECYDMLQFLKNAEETGWTDYIKENDKRIEMSKEIVLTIRFMSTAGFDTTSNTLAYLLHMLACKPEEQERLRAEIDSYDEINHDTIQQMQYLQWSIYEILRLIPHSSLSVFTTVNFYSILQSRRCVEDCQVNEFLFLRDTHIFFDTWTLHHDPDIWGSDAEEYRPSRFGDEKTVRQMQSWTPFGVGPRQCIGMRFALMELKTVICLILKQFRIRPIPGKEKVPFIGMKFPQLSATLIVHFTFEQSASLVTEQYTL
uniref:Cytochrome P450 n=1 Tax=Syphacia muris TaxID=451379 RepID=A0A0N5A9H7_9BILA